MPFLRYSSPMFPRVSVALLLLSITSSAQLNPSEQPLGEVVASDASIQGGVVLAASGASVLPGSTVDAGATAATIKLRRGGSVRVCPGSRITMNVAQPNQQQGVLLSLGTGEQGVPTYVPPLAGHRPSHHRRRKPPPVGPRKPPHHGRRPGRGRGHAGHHHRASKRPHRRRGFTG